jgi:hypothetical protein
VAHQQGTSLLGDLRTFPACRFGELLIGRRRIVERSLFGPMFLSQATALAT